MGIVDTEVLLDLCYEEDSRASVDFNIVMTDAGDFIEVQGTAEDGAFSRAQMDEMLTMAESGIRHLMEAQRRAIATLDG